MIVWKILRTYFMRGVLAKTYPETIAAINVMREFQYV